MYQLMKGTIALLLAGTGLFGAGKVAVEVTGAAEQPVAVSTTVAPQPPTTVAALTTAAPTTSTTTTVPLNAEQLVHQARVQHGKCGEWHDLAIAVGWPETEWPTLSFVLYRESRCNIDSWNKTDPNSGSRGLMQINGFWCRPNRYDSNGFLKSVGVLNTCDDLFDGETNLRAGLAIWTYGENKHGCGWRGPWATPCGKFTVAEPHPGI